MKEFQQQTLGVAFMYFQPIMNQLYRPEHDFFQPLQRSTFDTLHPLVKKLQAHPKMIVPLSLEEVFAYLVMVSKDLSMTKQEMAVWWVTLIDYGFDPCFEFLRTLYLAGYATKATLRQNTILDASVIQNSYVENFKDLYAHWMVGKDMDSVLSEVTELHYKIVPQFLQKDPDYERIVDTIFDTEGSSANHQHRVENYNRVVNTMEVDAEEEDVDEGVFFDYEMSPSPSHEFTDTSDSVDQPSPTQIHLEGVKLSHSLLFEDFGLDDTP